MTTESEVQTTTHNDIKRKVVASVVTSTIFDGTVSVKRRYLGGALPREASADHDASEGWPTFYDKPDWGFDFESRTHFEEHADFWRSETARRYHATDWSSLILEQITMTRVTETKVTTTTERVRL